MAEPLRKSTRIFKIPKRYPKVENLKATPAPRKGGRPRKHPLKPNPEIVNTNQPPKTACFQETMAPRKRGRPRKHQLKPKPEIVNTNQPLNGDKIDNDSNKENVKLTAEGAFDKLVDPEYKRQFVGKIKTYTNKHKLQPQEKLLEFEDCKNRDTIIEWLNDNRNCFDRLTQTQTVPQCDSQVMTLDMPSVSQLDSSESGGCLKITTKTRRSPYKLRARSLENSVNKKNALIGRTKRHSLATDTPAVENYKIEDEDDVLCPAEDDAKLLIDLMEDEYLNSIERELENNIDKKNLSGWDRIKKIKKTIPKKKQVKKLKIEVSQNHRDASESRCEIRTYDLDVLEDYFVDEMAKLIDNNEEKSESPLKNLQQTSSELLQTVKKLSEQQKDEFKINLLPLFNELKLLFGNSSKDKDFVDADTQTDAKKIKNIQTQICDEKYSKETQTFVDILETETQTSVVNLLNAEIQTEECFRDKISVEIQTDDVSIESSAKTASDIFESQRDEEKYNLGGTLDYVYFETEALIEEKAKTGKRPAIEEKADSSVATKRPRRQSLEEREFETNAKKPCNRFVNDDLSIAFESCTERFVQPAKKTDDVAKFEEESEDFKLNETLVAIMEKYEKSASKPEPVPEQPKSEPRRRTTQEELDYCENLLYNATKPTRVEDKSISIRSDEICISNNNFVDAEHLNKIENDYFKAETPPKPSTSRRSLFTDKSNNSESESLFVHSRNEDSVDNLLRGIHEISNSGSEETRKIKILQNIVVKEPHRTDDSDSESSDVVECTPVKQIPGLTERRSESSMLDVTLPPPLAFQDSLRHKTPVKEYPKRGSLKTPERRPLADLKQNSQKKITSTPISQKPETARYPSQSPITPRRLWQRPPPKFPKAVTPKKPERGRVPGVIELAQQSKFSPLTIIQKQPRNSQLPASKQQKSILNYIKNRSQESLLSSPSPRSFKRKPCIACTRLSREQVISISSMTNKRLATYSTVFSKKVTHMVVSVDHRNYVKDHTMKFVSAVAAGIWVVSFKWIQECHAKNAIVPEEPYEVLDVSGEPGPKLSRTSIKGSNQFLKGFKICAVGPFLSCTLKEVQNVVVTLGGKLVHRPEELLDKRDYICLIVTEASATQDFDMYETWLEILNVATVDIEWVCRSVGQFKMLSLRPFVLCSDESIEKLGYPEYLLDKTPFSFSQHNYTRSSISS